MERVHVGRRGRIGLLVAAAALAVAAAAPSVASAAEVSTSGTTITFTAGPVESNIMQVTNPSGNTVKIADAFPIPVTETSGSCIRTQQSVVECDLGPISGVFVNLDLGSGSDIAETDSTNIPISAEGGPGVDTIVTGGGNDVLIGGDDTDGLRSGDGNDLLDGGSGLDNMDGEGDSDTLTYAGHTAGVDVNLADGLDQDGNAEDGSGDIIANVENVIGTDQDDSIVGTSDDNEIQGLAGSDDLDGGGGTDTLSYRERGSAVTVDLTQTGHVQGGADDGVAGSRDEAIDFENIVSGDGGDVLTGNSAGNLIQAGDGEDEIHGGSGDDLLDGSSGDDVLSGEGGGDRLYGWDGGDALDGGTDSDELYGGDDADAASGGAGDDRIEGGGGGDAGTIHSISGLGGDAGNDTILGGAGDDALSGGADTDTASFEGSPAGVTASLGAGTATGEGNDTLAGFERLIGSDLADTLRGDAANNSLTGRGDDDTLEGLAGNDALAGGSGTDTVTYENETATVASLTAGSATNSGGTDTLSGVDGLFGSPAQDSLTGDSNGNVLRGNGGNDSLSGREADDDLLGGGDDDTLAGGDGYDDLDGGSGSDTADYSQLSCCRVIANLIDDTAVETDDTIYYADTLPGIENLVGSNQGDHLTGDDDDAGNRLDGRGGADTVLAMDGPDTIIGGAGGDLVQAGDGADTLEGNGDFDQLDGGQGDDTVTYANAAAGVIVNLELGGGGSSDDGDGSTDNLPGVDNVIGSAHADLISGRNGQVNTLSGAGGADTVLGRGDGDHLVGGGGTDKASFTSAPAAVTANLATGVASGGAGTPDDMAGFENLTGTASQADTLIGDGGANTLDGQNGDDTLRGAGGADLLVGGPGLDTADYSAAAGPVTASLNSGQAGADGDGSTDSFSSIGGLTGSANNDDLTGLNGTADVVNGLGGNDLLRERDGAPDTIDCGAGTDRAITDATEGSVTACEKNDDPAAPGAPAITGSNPASGGDDNDPEISGTAPAGSTVNLYAGESCAGTPLASGPAATFSGTGITVSVADNSSTTLTAQAVDPLDGESPSGCSAPFTYVETSDVAPPETSLIKPLKKTKDTTPTFKFSSSETGSTFACKVDKGALAPCSSPATLKKLKPGKHTFQVQATDAAGNVDASPAQASFKVKRKRKK